MKKVKISSLQQTPNKTSSSLISTLQTINSIQQHSSLILTITKMEHNDWLKLLQDLDYDLNVLADIDIDGLQRDNDMETSTNPDPNIPAEQPVDNASDSGPLQAGSSNAQNTGSDPANSHTGGTTEEDLGSSETHFDTETSVDPDPNGPVEEPVENAPDPRPSQAGSSEARNTGNDQGDQRRTFKPEENSA
ncbi:hypothetical protein FGLOB1_2592 [Fusarium globosum]|uniref:Uncharacterized protein n=1 Tax=Fusarium globosum TaxID=78864 RepID=A0A8H5YQ56_9HYPO|nr:hypothetical protein FGLOB1_2592 [Fusarium globosum]